MNDHINMQSLPPKWVIRFIQGIRTSLFTFYNLMFPGNVVLYEKFQALYLLPSIFVAAELNIAGLLKYGKKPIEEIARETGSDPDSLYRVMRALASQKIFRETNGKIFSNTRLSIPLMDGNGSLRHMFRHHLGRLNWQISGDLLETVQTGKDGFNRIYHMNIYDYLSREPESYAVFDQSMSELSSLGLAPMLQAFSFHKIKKLADIGGGEGSLLANILLKNPTMQGILFDLPSALVKSEKILTQYNVSKRVTITEGNFMESVPEGADTYLLKHILHNWSDSACITILSNIRKVLPVNGRILIIEMIVRPGNTSSDAKMIDIQMLTSMPGGKERTKEEFISLLQNSGLTLFRHYSTIAPFSILEARRIS